MGLDCPRRSDLFRLIGTSRYYHFHVGVGPAALKAAAALPRRIVDLHAKQILAGG